MHMVQFGTPTTQAIPFVLQAFVAVKSQVKNILENSTLNLLKRMVKVHGRNHFEIV